MASAAERLASNVNFGAFGKATELKQRIWFTLAALIVYRLGTYIPIPGVDSAVLASVFDQAGGAGVLIDQRTFGNSQRVAVWHLHIAGDASGNGCCRFRANVALMLKARLAEVHLIVDHPGYQIGTVGVEDLGVIWGRYVYTLNALPFNYQLTFGNAAFVDDACVDYALIHDRILTSASISTGTLKGSSAIPTALRECAPISGPKICNTVSEQPLITAGILLKLGAVFTMPKIFRRIIFQ